MRQATKKTNTQAGARHAVAEHFQSENAQAVPALVPLLYVYCAPHKKKLLALVGILMLACAFFSSTLLVREDVRTLIPSKPERLTEDFALLSHAPFIQRLTITVGASGGDPIPAAKALKEALRCSLIPTIITGPSVGMTPQSLSALCDMAPGLLDGKELAAQIAPALSPEGMRGALAEAKRELLSPAGIALRDVIARDPLKIHTLLFKKFAVPGKQGRGRVEQGHIVSGDGQYALLLAETPVPVTDSAAAAKVMDVYNAAVKTLPPGTEVIMAGGHRHAAANAAAIKADLARVLPASLLLLAVLFGVFIRSRYGLVIALVPFAALCVASTVTGLTQGAVSGIVLGFGGVLLGITSDYAIHVFFALRTPGGTPAGKLRAVTSPLCMGALTTLSAFCSLLTSNIPGLVQLAVFASSGVLAALALALFVLPHCLASSGSKPVEPVSPEFAPAMGAFAQTEKDTRSVPEYQPRIAVLAVVWGGLAAAILCLGLAAPISGDIRELSYQPEDVRRDEERTRTIWGGMREAALVVAQGSTLDAALQVNDAVWEELRSQNMDQFAASIAPVLPSLLTQQKRHAAWEAFWLEHAASALQTIQDSQKDFGFSSQAFAPFAAWIRTPPFPVTPKSLSSFGGDMLLPLFTAQNGESELVFTHVPNSTSLSTESAMRIENTGARIVSGEAFRALMKEASRQDVLRLGGVALLAITFSTALLFRSPVKTALALLPVGTALAAVLGVFHLAGLTLNIFHIVALPLVMGLSVDYGIFMVFREKKGGSGVCGVSPATRPASAAAHGSRVAPAPCEEDSKAHVRNTRNAVVLSALTTIAGFGCLVLAQHPALFSIGVTVAIGIGAALPTAVWGIPFLERRQRHVS